MSSRQASKRARFARAQRIRRALIRISRDSAERPGFGGLVTGMSLTGGSGRLALGPGLLLVRASADVAADALRVLAEDLLRCNRGAIQMGELDRLLTTAHTHTQNSPSWTSPARQSLRGDFAFCARGPAAVSAAKAAGAWFARRTRGRR